MTRAETADLMALIAEEHPKFLESPNPELRLNLWAEIFECTPYDIAGLAIKRVLTESSFAPKLYDVVQTLKNLTDGVKPASDELSAWYAENLGLF